MFKSYGDTLQKCRKWNTYPVQQNVQKTLRKVAPRINKSSYSEDKQQNEELVEVKNC